MDYEKKEENAVSPMAITITFADKDQTEFSVEKYMKDWHPLLFDFFKEEFDNFVFQLEQGSEGNKWHLQCCVYNSPKKRVSTVKHTILRDFPHLGPVHCAPAHCQKALKTYCIKTDRTIRAGPWGKRKIYTGKDLPTQLYKWQEELKEYCLKEGENRKVRWMCDLKGCIGKSVFCKLMGFKYGCVNLTYGNDRNLMALVAQHMGAPAYLIDLPRTKPKDVGINDLYSTIEKLKGGTVVDTMYRGSTQYMDPPNVVVFANYMPDFAKLTDDRWEVYIRHENTFVPFVPKKDYKEDKAFL